MKLRENIVRVRNSYWSDRQGVHRKTSVLFLKRATGGSGLLEEDVSNIGAAMVMRSIVNLDTVRDGIYRVITVDHQTDWEDDSLFDYNYKLVPL